MRKTLLLVFIHGFKGGDDTFGTFPSHFSTLVGHALPDIDITWLAYPRFETRGDLKECVGRFRDWLQNQVIDLEVVRGTPSPTVDPSVHVILVGHSMGGIVAAEALLLLASEQPIPPMYATRTNPETPNFPSNSTLHSTTSTSRPNPPAALADDEKPTVFLFPHIQGVLAFDTPFLGLEPGMVAHGIEGGHKMATTAYTEVANILGWGNKPNTAASSASTATKSAGALPPPSTVDAAATPGWQRFGKYAMFAGAAGALAAGGAAALYSQREKLSAGWNWAGSHLLFIGDLGKPEVLKKRVETMEKVCAERGIGCANLYTNLGSGAREGYGITATLSGKERTFCNLPIKVKEQKNNKTEVDPSREAGGATGLKWIKSINDKAKDETTAHVSMFFPRDNPGFYGLSETAKQVLESWIDQRWYQSSTPTKSQHPRGLDDDDEGWEKPEPTHGIHTASKPATDISTEQFAAGEPPLGKDWEGLDKTEDLMEEEEADVSMHDEILDDPWKNAASPRDSNMMELEGSVIVEKGMSSSTTEKKEQSPILQGK